MSEPTVAHRQHVHHSVEPVQEVGEIVSNPQKTTPYLSGADEKHLGTTHELGSSPSNSHHDNGSDVEEQKEHIRRRGWYSGYRVYWHLLFFVLATAWWVAGLVLHRPGNGKHKELNWVVPFLLWLFFSLRLLTFHVSPQPLFDIVKLVWRKVFVATLDRTVPVHLRGYAGAVLTAAVFLVGTMASPETEQNRRKDRAVSLFGLCVFLAVLFATSNNRSRINWKTVQVGLLSQFILALFVLRTGVGYDIFHFVSNLAVDLLGFAGEGFAFLFAPISTFPTKYFVILVLPAIIFFVSVIAILSHWGALQWVLGKFAIFFWWALDASGAEAIACAASPFIGQGESAILIAPYVPHLTKAELHQVMTAGFATIAGSVFGAYVGLGANPQVLLSSCIMSIPASIAFSKMRYPETDEPLTAGRCVVPANAKKEPNVIAAFTNGAMLGLRIAGAIAALLLVIISLVALIDALLGWFGQYFQVPQLTIAFVLGYLFYPVAWLLGVPGSDLYRVGQLIGIKIVQNEFVAYLALLKDPAYATLSSRGKTIATYALCGFGNIGSLGNQAAIFVILAPERTRDVSRIGPSALLTGIMATLMSASIGGMVLTREL